MDLKDRVVVITGAAGGIGAALARRFAAGGARAVVVSDIDVDGAAAVADQIEGEGGHAVARTADATSRTDIRALVALARAEYGQLDMFCSNAGVAFGAGIHALDDQWVRSWQVNVMHHVYAAQAALPGMVRAGSGYLLLTASAAGLLGLPGDAPYSVSKHATIGLAEWLAVTYRPRGVRVSALCPLGVRTPLLVPGIEAGHPASTMIAAAAPLLEPDEVAEATVAGVAAERLMILPHEVVAERHARKAADPDAWVDATVAETAAVLGARR